MNTTKRAQTEFCGKLQFEPLPQYGWRCGMYSLRPELSRHATNPEFRDGLRRGRAQRQRRGIAPSMALILGLPHLREMHSAIRAAYSDAADADRRLASAYRAAAGAAGQISSMGRDIGAVRLANADRDAADVSELWAEHRRLSDEYAAEINRMCRIRGLPDYVTSGA